MKSHPKNKPTANAMIVSSHQLAANHSGVIIISSLSECGMIGEYEIHHAGVHLLTPTYYANMHIIERLQLSVKECCWRHWRFIR